MTSNPDLITQSACIVRCEGARAWVRSKPLQGCQRCAEGRGCGAGILQVWLSNSQAEIEVDNSVGAIVGQRVQIGVSARRAVLGALRLYGLPLAGVLVGALVGASLWPHSRDLAAFLGASTCLLGGILLVRFLERRSLPMLPVVDFLPPDEGDTEHDLSERSGDPK